MQKCALTSRTSFSAQESMRYYGSNVREGGNRGKRKRGKCDNL